MVQETVGAVKLAVEEKASAEMEGVEKVVEEKVAEEKVAEGMAVEVKAVVAMVVEKEVMAAVMAPSRAGTEGAKVVAVRVSVMGCASCKSWLRGASPSRSPKYF